jgi:hypothetical protein
MIEKWLEGVVILKQTIIRISLILGEIDYIKREYNRKTQRIG